MFFSRNCLSVDQARTISPRLLAHLGDAVFHLFERERKLLTAATVSQLHRVSSMRATARAQAQLLDMLSDLLTEQEADLVRRARNIKPQRQKRAEQASYRKSTAFEALLGYLYVTDTGRLKQILALTLTEDCKGSPGAELPNLKDRL